MTRVATVLGTFLPFFLLADIGVGTSRGDESILVMDPDVYVQDSSGQNTSSARIGEDIAILVNLRNMGDSASPSLRVRICLEGNFRVNGGLDNLRLDYPLPDLILPANDVYEIRISWNTETDFANLGYFVVEDNTYDIIVFWEPKNEALESSNNTGVQYKLDALRIIDETNKGEDATIWILLLVIILIVVIIGLVNRAWKQRMQRK